MSLHVTQKIKSTGEKGVGIEADALHVHKKSMSFFGPTEQFGAPKDSLPSIFCFYAFILVTFYFVVFRLRAAVLDS